jgi:hypothetical protein
MARDTRSPVPGQTNDLKRVSLTASHWHRGRWWLLGQGVVLAGFSAVTLAILGSGAGRDAVVVADLPIGWLLAWSLLGVGIVAAVAASWRRVALPLTATICVAALGLVVICAVAGAHHAHPFGSTTAVLLLWSALFCYNFAIAIWLVPDHIEGPAWVPRRRSSDSPLTPNSGDSG